MFALAWTLRVTVSLPTKVPAPGLKRTARELDCAGSEDSSRGEQVIGHLLEGSPTVRVEPPRDFFQAAQDEWRHGRTGFDGWDRSVGAARASALARRTPRRPRPAGAGC
jgi:hypothetical protein